jgi:DNA repair protein RecN (Recombination protein N)
MADTHLLITKGEEAGYTLTRVTNLDIRGSINELARLIGGAEITEATFEAAREMKDMAAHVKLD